MPRLDPLLIDLPEEFIGQQVVVRPWRAGDGAGLFAAVKESLHHVHPWLPWGPLHTSPSYSETLVRRFRSKYDLREDMPMSIRHRETGQLLGGCGLHRIDWEVRSFEIGYWIRSSAAGRGYVTEAAHLLTALAFDYLEANRVFIRVVVENTKSVAIPKRLGFIEEGTHRNAILDANGELRNLLVFGLTPEDWCKLKQQAAALDSRSSVL